MRGPRALLFAPNVLFALEREEFFAGKEELFWRAEERIGPSEPRFARRGEFSDPKEESALEPEGFALERGEHFRPIMRPALGPEPCCERDNRRGPARST